MMKKTNLTIFLVILLIVIIVLSVVYKNQLLNFLSGYNKSEFRSVLEIIYFISSPILLIVAIVGLKQITVSKENAKKSTIRDSYKLASEQCKYFLDNIIPLYNTIDNYLCENSITLLDEKNIEITPTTIRFDAEKYVNQYDKLIPIIEDVLSALNATEAFAVYIITGVANEEIAFNSIGRTYCNCLNKFLPLIIMVGKGDYFKHCIKLFLLWQIKDKKMKMLRDKDKIEKNLKNMYTPKIKNIGI